MDRKAETAAQTSACPGCGAWLPETDGPSHAYIGASSACWVRFAELNVTLPPVTPMRRLVTDAYMVQHPGVPERRAIQSVGLHLVALCLVLEHRLPAEQLSGTLARLLEHAPAWRWLEPPVPNGRLTIVDLGEAAAAGDPRGMIEAYVQGQWDAWAGHHATVQGWAKAVLP